MKRITLEDLQLAIDRLNRQTGSPMEPWKHDDRGVPYSQSGNYHLSRAYGGFALHRMTGTGGGVECMFGGYMPARELLGLIRAYSAGLAEHDKAD